MIPENGRLATAQCRATVELDEIFRAFDKKTREGFQTWQRDLGKGIEGRGQDFSDALGSLPGFANNTNEVLKILNSQERATQLAIKNTGVVFDALTERDGQLADWITNSNRLSADHSSTRPGAARNLGGVSRVHRPVYGDASRLEKYAENTEPLMVQLQPVATASAGSS